MKRNLLTFALLGLPAMVLAQAPAPTPTATPTAAPTPEPPKPAPELAKLQFLVGDWTHDELHHGGPTGVAARGVARSKIAWILGGHRLYITYKSVSAAGEQEGRGILGWDTEDKAYRLDWYDNRGRADRYSGSFNPEEALVLAGEPVIEGERHRQQLTIRKQPGGKFLLTDESAPADQVPKLTLESLASAAATPTATATPATGATPTATPAAGTVGQAVKPTPTPTPASSR
jgi:uncharacterized protein DUF1579